MPILEPPGPPPNYSTMFSVDAMFYSAARKARERADRAVAAIRRAEKKVFTCQMKMARIRERAEERGEDAYRYYDEFEPLAIQMESLEASVVEAHGPVLRELAQAHILCAASLEAHINIRAENLLSKRSWTAFEKMGIDAKWLCLPKLQDLAGFDVGAQPFQGFDRLIKIRNRLVHWKDHKEPYHGFEDPDSFAQKLSLTFDSVDESVGAVKGMVSELSKQLGEERAPWWLDSEFSHFFEVRADEPKTGKKT
jgi:hypothetical protein